MKKRIPIPKNDIAIVLSKNRHTCCICHVSKNVQTHHLDGDTTNNIENNIAIVCINCHDNIHKKGKMSRNYLKEEIEIYKKDWEEFCKRLRPKTENNIEKSLLHRMKEPNDKIEFLKTLSSELFQITKEITYIFEVIPLCGHESGHEEKKRHSNNFDQIYLEYYNYYHRYRIFTNETLDELFTVLFKEFINGIRKAMESWNSMRYYHNGVGLDNYKYWERWEKLNGEISDIVYKSIPKINQAIMKELRKSL